MTPKKQRPQPPSQDLIQEALALEQKHFTTNFDPSNIEFEILSSMRYDPKLYAGSEPLYQAIDSQPIDKSFFFLFPYHVRRLNKSIAFFEFDIPQLTESLLIEQLTLALSTMDRLQSYRIRVLACKTGEVKFDIHPESRPINVTSDPEPSYTVLLDSEPTASSPFTSFKTTNRPHYDAARTRHVPQEAVNTEVLLFNPQAQLTEASTCNIALKKPWTNPVTGEVVHRWITPPLSCGCLSGIVRQWMIDQGNVHQGILKKEDLVDGEEVLLFNGVIGVVKGTLNLGKVN